jgi:glycosyltransferase involved in cell wall biosynthesis
MTAATAAPGSIAEEHPAPHAPGAAVRLLEVVTRLDVGGVPAHLMLLLEGLRSRGYEITVACGECIPEHERKLAALGIPLVRLPLRRLLSPVADGRGLVELYRLIRSHQFDIVHTHMSKAALLGGCAARLARARVVVNTAHNLGSIAMPRAWLRALFWIYDKLLLSLTADAVVTVSERVRDTVVRDGLLSARRVFSIHNGIRPTPGDVHSFAPLEAIDGGRDRLVVGTVARLVWFKGLNDLVAAAPAVVKAFPQTVFVLVGDGPERDHLEHEANELGVAANFIFFGERHDVPSLLRGFDLFVLPSVSEGLPITILEAMAAGKAVIATEVGGVPELVEHGVTGLLVPPRDPTALGAALISLLGDRPRRSAMGRSGRQRLARAFNAERMVAETDALFQRLLRAASP